MEESETMEQSGAWKPKGFFGRLVSRFAQNRAPNVFIHPNQEASVARADSRAAKSPLEQACDQFMERIESLSSEEPWETDAIERSQYKEARDLWSGLATGAIKQSRQSMILAVKAGVADESVFASQFIEALKENHGGWDAHKQASLLFELGWEKDKVHDGYMRKIDEPERWRACKLKAYGSRAPEAMADLAVFAKVMQRAADLALGNWPKFSGDSGNLHWSETSDFANDDGIWLKNSGSYLSPWDEIPMGVKSEPSIGMLVNRLGDLPISWLARHSDQKVSSLAGSYAKHWKVTGSRGWGKTLAGDEQWELPKKEFKAKQKDAALMAGVPAWALGAEPVPRERILHEGLKYALSHEPSMWGEEFAEAQKVWVEESKKERHRISEDGLSASYSDDASCRSSESAQCAREDRLVNAQESFLDWSIRRNLPADHPWAASAKDMQRTMEDVARVDGSLLARGGVAAFATLARSLGWSEEQLKDGKSLGETMLAMAEAHDIKKCIGDAGSARVKSSPRL